MRIYYEKQDIWKFLFLFWTFIFCMEVNFFLIINQLFSGPAHADGTAAGSGEEIFKFLRLRQP